MKRMIAGTLVLVFLLSGCTSSNVPQTGELFIMSTYVTQQVYGEHADEAIRAVNELLEAYDATLSLYKEDSEISRINQNAGIAPTAVSAETFSLIQKAKQYSESSGGLFDLTVAPLSTLWGVNSENPRVPSDEEIAAALDLVDYRDVILKESEQTVYLKREGMAIDLGGIAKGFFCEKIEQIYRQYGVSSALVSIGGNIYTYEQKPDGESYRLGIRNPNDLNGSSVMGILCSHDEVVSTSGAYERYFEQDGMLYHHILDLETGFPAQSDLLSVTVICKDGGLADFLSTALYLEGSKAIASYLDSEQFQVIVIDQNNQVYISPSLNERFTITDSAFLLSEAVYSE